MTLGTEILFAVLKLQPTASDVTTFPVLSRILLTKLKSFLIYHITYLQNCICFLRSVFEICLFPLISENMGQSLADHSTADLSRGNSSWKG